MAINPSFDLEALGMGAIQDEAARLAASAGASSEGGGFPLGAFPAKLQRMANTLADCLNYPPDFTGAGMLFAASVAIGNSHRVRVAEGHIQSALIFLALVGPSGIVKTHPLKFMVQPLDARDKATYRAYKEQLVEYKRVAALTKAERESQGLAEPEPPTWPKLLISDFTPEALAKVLQANQRGIGVYADELAGWIKNFDRYHQGGATETWLSVWSGGSINVDRKGGESIYLPSPFASVGGTIQPGVLAKMAENLTENGFLARILFTAPDGLQAKPWPDKEMPPNVAGEWGAVLDKLLDLEMAADEAGEPYPAMLNFEPTAKEKLYKWQAENVAFANQSESDTVKGVAAKIEVNTVRLALILQLLRWACGDGERGAVGVEAVRGAIQLAGYFQRCALKVAASSGQIHPLEALPANKQQLYQALPAEFATAEAVGLAAGHKLQERAAKDFLKNNTLFEKTSHGHYRKR
jgi:hypothetical protein